MILGIKVGPQRQSFLDLEQTNAPFAEVWFNILQQDAYTDLFTEMKRRKMAVGLHFWGHLSDGTWTNLALPNTKITDPSMTQLKQTIDIAAANQFQYVNFHPSTRTRVTINLDTQTFAVHDSPIPESQAEELFFERLTILNNYAKQKGILLTIETIPTRDANGWRDSENRKHPLDLYNLDNSVVVKATTRGFTIANDFGHTVCSVRTDNRTFAWSTLVQMTKKMFHQTKLLHLGYVIPPYNGTDYHDHLDNPMFNTDQAVPNRPEMIELLRMFKDQKDVYVLAEPDGRHVENYLIAKTIIDSL